MLKEVKDWCDITIGQYQELRLVESESAVTKTIEQIAIAVDCDPQYLRELSLDDFYDLRNKMAFLQKDPEKEMVNIIEIDGKRYGLIPDMMLMKTSEFVDAEMWKEKPIENLHNYIAMLYRPIIFEDGDEYKIEPHKPEGFARRANLFKNKVSIELVIGAVVFFSLLEMKLLECLTGSFQKELQTNLKEIQRLMKTKKTRTPSKSRKGKRSKNNGASTT